MTTPKKTTKVFSKPQRAAIETFDSDVSVSAGAGSGKTTLLVERYLRAVTVHGADPSEILAITFTDKAANEMKERLARECLERGLEDVRRQLEDAAVSTIHAFCSRVLKESPIESGVDPFFTLLSDGEADLLTTRTLDRIFEEEGASAFWLSVLQDYGEAEVRFLFRQWYQAYRAAGDDAALFRVHDSAPVRKALAIKAAEGFKRLIATVGEGGTDAEKKLSTASRVLASFFEAESGKEPAWDAVIRLKTALKDFKHHPKFAEAVKSSRAASVEWISAAAQKLAEPVKKELVRMFHRFKDAYETEKRLLGTYDFDDLILLAYRLFSGDSVGNRAVLARYRKRFKWILVDEFQDTSLLQSKLIRLLGSGKNLFFVGDVQQSIYGFRHADPETFANFAVSGDIRTVTLGENYRSRPEILAFVNAVFTELFDGRFQPLKAMKPFPAAKTPAVELLPVWRQEKDGGIDSSRVKEAEWVAARIAEWAASGKRAWRDIAILFKSSTSSYLYEAALEKAAIPYRVTKGRGFFDKPEVKDLLNFLVVLEDRGNDIALAGVLRSPLVGISEDALFHLSTEARKDDKDAPFVRGLERIENIKALTPADREKLLSFREILDRLGRNKNRLRISRVLRWMSKRASLEAKTLTEPEGLQKTANIRKLIELAESMETGRATGIQDFIGFLKNLAERDIPEPEAVVGGNEDVVTVSTIHAAKGLEFPCVFVADMGGGKRGGGRGDIVSDLEGGVGALVKNPLNREWEKDRAYGEITSRTDTKESAEDLRKLYVAMTRAEELLVLSGALALNKDGDVKEKTWLGRLARLTGLTPDSEELKWSGVKIRVVKGAAQPVPVKPKAALEKSADNGKKFLEDLRKRINMPIQTTESSEDLSVTRLMEGDAAEKERLEEPEFDWSEEDETPSTPRNEFGTIFHKAMELSVLRGGAKMTAAQMKNLLMPLTPVEREEVEASLERFWAGEWGKAVRAASERHAELPFLYKTPHGILKGQLDLVFRTARGEWIVLDYKTNRITSAEKEAASKEYRFQLAAYALVFKKLYGQAPSKGVLYFSTIGEVIEFPLTQADFAAAEKELLERFRGKVLELTGSRGQGILDF